MSLSDRFVLVMLVLNSNDSLLCNLSVPELAKQLNVPTTTLLYHVRNLKKKGVVVPEQQQNGKRGRTIRYRVTTEAKRAMFDNL